MSNFIISQIRTYVPMIIGAVIAWLTVKGIKINPSEVDGLVAFLTALFSGLYYLIVRLLEAKFPQLGWLLGQAQKPTYTGGK